MLIFEFKTIALLFKFYIVHICLAILLNRPADKRFALPGKINQ
jgi:hypothetical protein